jgi:hypothetical protein
LAAVHAGLSKRRIPSGLPAATAAERAIKSSSVTLPTMNMSVSDDSWALQAADLAEIE